MIKRLTFALAFFCLSLFSASSVLAQEEFSTSYHVDYQINAQGQTHTVFNITLTNQLSNVYASEFALSIGSTQLSDIKAYDSNYTLEPTINRGDKTTSIKIPFKDKILGKDKARTFTLEFVSRDFANQLGSIWEISIPKLQKTDSLNSYNLTLSIPKSFGKPSTISPEPATQSSSGSYTVYRFSPEDLLVSGISATFGLNQNYDFRLNYHLQNPNIYQIQTEIALPPDTAFQKMIYQTLEPRPQNITLDPDGNWMATYFLNPKELLHITATGSAEIYLTPRHDFSYQSQTKTLDYLSPKQYWESDNPKIKEIAEKLKTPRNIYQYVVDNLIYDYGRLSEITNRFGAANVLDNQDSAICMEFTDLFVALARAAGIKARAVNGFAYTTNAALRPLSLKKDILHAWPEYYDENKSLWVPIDPTWGNTTGGVDFFSQPDLNHFTFAILGLNSDYPIPAGAYKIDSNETKDIDINFGQSIKSQPQTNISLNLPLQSLAGIPINGRITLTNTGNTAVYNQSVSLNSKRFTLPANHWFIPVLPPFASYQIDFELPATGFADSFTDSITVNSDLSSLTHQLTLLPAYNLILNELKRPLIQISLLSFFTLIFLLIFLKRKILKKRVIK